MPSARKRKNNDLDLRGDLLELKKYVREKKPCLQTSSLEEFKDVCTRADALTDRIHKPRENTLSSTIFKELTDIGMDRASKLVERDTMRDLIGNLKRGCWNEKAGGVDWRKLGKEFEDTVTKPSVGMSQMIGLMGDRNKKPERKGRGKRNVDKLEECVEPVVKKPGKEKEDEKGTDKLMEEMYRVLRKEVHVPFAELVVNPYSFAQTVENVFALSFLVKDKRVSFSKDEEFGMVVSIVPRAQKRKRDHEQPSTSKKQRTQSGAERIEEETEDDGSGAFQTILRIDYGFYNALKSVVLERDCRMKHRKAKDEGPSSMMDKKNQSNEEAQ